MAGVFVMLWRMGQYEKLTGVVSMVTNTPGTSTGYGVQAQFLMDRMMRHGLNVAVQSNYGLEGRFEKIKTKWGDVAHYPKGFKPYSDDVIKLWHDDFVTKHPGKKNAVFTLYDVWVYNQLEHDGPIISYVPLDHVTVPPGVKKFLMRDNVTPVTMAPHGQRLLESRDIKSHYAPHMLDAKIYKPTQKINGVPTRQFMEIGDDDFLVSIVAANKSNGIMHRKALAEQIVAFSLFLKDVPNAKLYLHMEGSKVFGGFNIPVLLQAVGLTNKNVIIADATTLRVGYPAEQLAAIYTASDVVMNATYGEGFGVVNIESQACGTRLITSSWTASEDLAGPDSFQVAGQPLWDEPQSSFYNIPSIPSLYEALKLAYDAPRGISHDNIQFARQFEVEHVWDTYWMPFFKEFFA